MAGDVDGVRCVFVDIFVPRLAGDIRFQLCLPCRQLSSAATRGYPSSSLVRSEVNGQISFIVDVIYQGPGYEWVMPLLSAPGHLVEGLALMPRTDVMHHSCDAAPRQYLMMTGRCIMATSRLWAGRVGCRSVYVLP